ncbi:hypothetical protein [Bdellovibrio sp. HCB209]|uniref:hypothetical protein n=1 Tax=Bdellovibrio sp. HCB209 TaxID=3394354 RepID=UPI0039B367FC
MKTRIFVTAFIFLTVGCQPSKDGSLLSHSDTDITGRGFQDHGTTQVKQLSGGHNPILRLQGNYSAEDVSASADPNTQLNSELTSALYDATVRMQMDLAGIKEYTNETQTLEKLLTSKAGPDGAPVLQALKKGTLSIDLQNLGLTSEGIKISVIAKAFKQVAVQYGLSEAEQKTVEQAVLSRSVMLAPLESHKSMAEANGSLLQSKVNEAVIAVGKNQYICASIELLKTAAANFYGKEAHYVLPALTQTKGKIIAEMLNEVSEYCIREDKVSRKAMAESLTSAVEAISFDLGSLELYLHPKDTFNWPEFENYKIRSLVQEVGLDADIALSDISCALNGKELQLREPQQSDSATVVAFDLPIAGAYPLTLEKNKMQKGVTLSFVASASRVTHFNGMTLTKIKPNILVPALNVIPDQKMYAQFKFTTSENSTENSVVCELKRQTK